ncbi:MAG: hypothetical protein A2Z20_09545 [Bdellovibrionales bacterium RBG_16_40_8]|nr:MAG: hypothetical protein A2Z20_09545 [Bdellovibrionales bacterium RBG_16_40_8]
MREVGLKDIQKIYIEESAMHTPVAKRALKIFSQDKIELVTDEPYLLEKGNPSAKQFDRSKKELFITNFKGQFFKRCPGAKPGLTCCNYFVLNLGQQCNMNCSYCYLQGFINSPITKIYANIDQALVELSEVGQTLKDHSLRIGTGEITDSLSLDELTLYSRELIIFFRDYPKWRLELKTKSSRVDQFLDVEHAKNIIISFSLNPQNIIASEEHGTASLIARLYAAQKSRDCGHIISFHLDPVIYFAGWQNSYSEMIDEITSRFTPQDVPAISIGTLRFQPAQRHLMRERFGTKSLTLQSELFQSQDGKLRYDQKLRSEMYEFIRQRFLAHSREWNIFLCMETPETWLETFGQMPKHMRGLGEVFDHRITHKLTKTLTKKLTNNLILKRQSF